jgi:hypothetical protein
MQFVGRLRGLLQAKWGSEVRHCSREMKVGIWDESYYTSLTPLFKIRAVF